MSSPEEAKDFFIQLFKDMLVVAKAIRRHGSNQAISEIPPEIHNFYENENGELVTEKTSTPILTELLTSGLCTELRFKKIWLEQNVKRGRMTQEMVDEVLTYHEEVEKCLGIIKR